MKNVQFVSLHGQSEVDVPDLGLRFVDKEIKCVTDEQAVALLTNPNFKEAKASAKPAPVEGKE